MTISKTAAGHQVLKDRSAGLSPRQRAALILIDGQRTLEEVLAATSPGGVTRADIETLLALGLVADEPGDSYPMPLAPRAAAVATPERERYMHAYALATQLTAALGRKGSELNLAVEAAGSLEELQALAPRIRQAVGPERFASLQQLLN
ncbi:MAG: hypothetical protein EOO30_17725 [Comamonadaceae bacterium]|nr:MAG: hypothetical protein EOO30_17725 [Comamonadaceae bacterium]